MLFEFLLLIFFAFIYDWVYRKTEAAVQGRVGPNSAGPFGILQPFADFIKLLGKEELVPRKAGSIWSVVPYVICILPLIGIWIILNQGNLGLIFVILGIDSLLLWLVGYYSKSRFALTGSMRLALLFFSYEIPFMLSVIALIVATGSFALTPISITLLPISFLIMVAVTFAKLEFHPFDAPTAPQEIVAGYLTEYGGPRLALMRLGKKLDLVMMAFFISAIFFSEYRLISSLLLVTAISLVSALLPRYRIDQAVRKLWIMTPLALIQIMGVSLW